jgi:DNA-binding MarR family transcriptional regulator
MRSQAMRRLFAESSLLFHRMRAFNDMIHGPEGITDAMRGVLLTIHSKGPQTVPHMAKARPVSRQHIQQVVNALEKEGFVELIPNPRHKRSKLVALTDQGKLAVHSMEEREIEILDNFAQHVPLTQIERGAILLHQLNIAFAHGLPDLPEEEKQEHPYTA